MPAAPSGLTGRARRPYRDRMQLSARSRFAAACAWGAFAAVASIALVIDAVAHKLVWALKQGNGDCVINWLGARAFMRGIDPYSPAGLKWAGLPSFGHPPTTPLWYLPFVSFGIYDLNQVFGHLLLVLLLVHFVLLAAEVRAPVALATAVLGYALVSDTTWWADHVHMIQISLPIAFLYLVAWVFLRRGHEVACGVVIGLALTLKLYAGLVVIMLLVGRRWRGAIAAAAVYLVAAAVATWRFGVGCWREYFAMLPATQNQWTAHIRNASLQGIVLRWWYPACGPRGHTLPVATALATLLSVAIVVALALGTRRALTPKASPPPVDADVDLPFAMFALASAWLNPVVWEHYDVTLIQPMAVALLAAWRLGGRGRTAWAAGVSAVLVVVALLLSIDMYAKGHAGSHAMLHAYEVANWLPWPLTLAACAAVFWRQRAEGAATPAGR